MESVNTVWKGANVVFEADPLDCEGVTVKEQDVIRVDLAYGGLESLVESWKTDMFGVSWLVHGIVAGNPGVVFVSRCDLFPQPDCTVLEVLVVPECRIVRWIIGVPVNVLTSLDDISKPDSDEQLGSTDRTGM